MSKYFFILLFLFALPEPSRAAEQDFKADLTGFVPLFDGKTLDGWSKLSDGGDWKVVDGTIVGGQLAGGRGGLLITEKKYSDYELYAEVLATYPLDTGLFLRILSNRNHYQVTIDYRPTGEIGAIYGPQPNGRGDYFKHCPEGFSHWNPNRFNPVRVRIEGQPPRVQVWIRDKQLMDFQDTPVDGKPRFEHSGGVGIQVHGGESWGEGSRVTFRNLMIKELHSK
jgi:hypothetical protein